MNHRSFLRLQPVLLGVGFALLIAISVATALLVDRAATDSRRLAETLAVQDQLSDVLLGVRRAESSQRGYLYTGNPNYLDDFRAAHPQVEKLFSELDGHAEHNPALQASLKRIKPLVDAKFSEMADSILLHEKGQHGAARAVVLGGKGRRLMAELQQLITGAIAQERTLAAEHSTQTRASSRWLLIVSLVGAGLIVLIGAASVRLVQRNARATEAARTELAVTNANLERIVEHRTEDLTEANEEIQRFAYIVSHDLRSPLVNIMGFTSELAELRKDVFEQVEKLAAELETLKEKSSEAEGAEGAAEEVAIAQLGADFDEALGFIKSSTATMDRLINAVLKLSREGRREFHPEPVDVNALVGALVDTAAHRAAELEATISVTDLPDVQSDALALQQIFTNLIDNALKYRRPEVPLQVEISGHITATQAIYEVKDNGRGIDARDHQRVFELFRRAGQQDQPGEGIGLAHVRALVRRIGGNMRLSSELGQGSVFTVVLPRQWSPNTRRAA